MRWPWANPRVVVTSLTAEDRPAQPLYEEDYCGRGEAENRIKVEHTIGRMRRYQALSQVDRHRRRGHTARVRAVAGLVNRVLEHQAAA